MVDIQSITVTGVRDPLNEGETMKLVAHISPPSAADNPILWSKTSGWASWFNITDVVNTPYEHSCVISVDPSIEQKRRVSVHAYDGNNPSMKSAEVYFDIVPYVEQIYVTSIDVTGVRDPLKEGTSMKLVAHAQPPDATNKRVNWYKDGTYADRYSITNIVDTDSEQSCIVTALGTAPGRRSIKVKAQDRMNEGAEEIVYFDISPKQPLVDIESINLSGPSQITLGDTGTFRTSIRPTDAYPGTIRWSIAEGGGRVSFDTVTNTYCRIRGDAVGSVVVKATSEDPSGVVETCSTEIVPETTYTFYLQYSAPGAEYVPPNPDPYTGTDIIHQFRVSSEAPRKPGFIFKHWTYDDEGTDKTVLPGGTVTVYQDYSDTVVLSAVWDADFTEVRFENPVDRMQVNAEQDFEAYPYPEATSGKELIFSVEGGIASIISETPTTRGEIARIRADAPGVFTIVASPVLKPDLMGRHKVLVDRAPQTHGTSQAPLTGPITGTVEEYKGDTFYVAEGTEFDLKATKQTGKTVGATLIEPVGSGISVLADGSLAGNASGTGSYVIKVRFKQDSFDLEYTMTVVIVATVLKPVTAIMVSGPAEVRVGERVTLSASTSPADADIPFVTFAAMDNRVRIISTSEDARSTTCIIEGRLQGDTDIRVTSKDGACSIDRRIRVLTDAPTGDEWVMDAGDGVFPNGEKVIRGPVGEGYLLPDWTVVDRPGYRLRDWTGSNGTTGAMAQFSTAGVRWTANWEEDVRDYPTEFLPHAAIRIYRDIDQFVDLTDMCVQGAEPIIQMAENRPEQAQFSIKNLYGTPSMHIIGKDCSMWSAGADGPISTGMYCRIEDIQSDGTVRPIFDGFVTTITPDADAGRIAITVGDRKAILSKSGTTIRRNYYKGRQAGTRINGVLENGRLYGDLTSLPADAQVEPPYAWSVPNNIMRASNNDVRVREPSGYGGKFWSVTMPALDMDILRFVYLDVKVDTSSSITKEWTSHGQLTVRTSRGTFSEGYTAKLKSKTTAKLAFDFASNVAPGIPVQGPITLELTTDIERFDYQGHYYAVFPTFDDVNSKLTSWVKTPGKLSTVAQGIAGEFRGFKWTPCEAHRENMRLAVDSIEGDPQIDSTFDTPPQGRMKVNFLSEDISTVQVMSGIALAVGSWPLPNNGALAAEDTMLKVFRTGGGYAQDYLQKLADIPSASKRMRAFRSRGFRTPVVMIGARYKVGDQSAYNLAYGGDSVPAGVPTVRFHQFMPNLTMKNRPSMVMIRGTGTTYSGDTLPLMVAVEDIPSRERRGVSVEQVLTDSSINNPLGAARAGYAQVSSNDLDTWEGSITLPGIIPDLMKLSGPFVGSGVPVTLYDSRNGIEGYPARVKEVTLNYSACTTTAVLVNHSIVHSSGLSDTVATAITAADVATGTSDNSLYATQYVRIVAELTQPVDRATLDNKVTIYYGPADTPDTAELSQVQFLDFPGNRTVMVAIAPEDGDKHTDGTRPYDVYGVQINKGEILKIPAPLRPDYYEGQTLIINVDFPTR